MSLGSVAGVSLNRDGTIASSSKAELKLAKQLAEGSRAGRFGGRAGKMARVRQQEEADAAAARRILAGSNSNGAASSGSNKRKQREYEPNGREDANPSSKDKDVAVPAKRKLIIVELPHAANLHSSFKRTPCGGWWGAKRFASAGPLEGLDEAEKHVSRERKTFHEDDQEALYMQTHQHKSQGKRGLGKSGKIKIAGGNWKGMKTTFEDETGEAAAANAAQDSDSEGVIANHSGRPSAAGCDDQPATSIGKQKRSKAGKGARGSSRVAEGGSGEASGQQPGEGACDECMSRGQKVKWVKLTSKILSEAKANRMRLKKFWTVLLADLRQQNLMADTAASQVEERCLKKLNKSSKFVIEGKIIRAAK